MKLRYKILIGLGIIGVLLIGIPSSIAIAQGKTEALKGLIETDKSIIKAHIETLKSLVDAYKEFLASL